MPMEIERRFVGLLKDIPDSILMESKRYRIVQGYLHLGRIKLFQVHDNGESHQLEMKINNLAGYKYHFKFNVDAVEAEELQRLVHLKSKSTKIYQDTVIRVRLQNMTAFLTMKGKKQNGSGLEFEYEIPFAIAKDLLLAARYKLVEKDRYEYMYNQRKFEIDIFCGANAGLVIIEIELASIDEIFALPNFLGNFKEITDDHQYSNFNLAKMPFTLWKKEEV